MKKIGKMSKVSAPKSGLKVMKPKGGKSNFKGKLVYKKGTNTGCACGGF